jgi:hypothetical protein
MISAEGCMGISTSNEVDGDARTSQTDLWDGFQNGGWWCAQQKTKCLWVWFIYRWMVESYFQIIVIF